MFALYDDERGALARLSGCLIAGAAAILPFTLPPQSVIARADAVPAVRALDVPAVPRGLQFPELDLARDPFLPDASLVSKDALAGASGPAAELRALVLGDDSHALVEIDGKVRVLGIGDAVGSERIVSIDARGVSLSGGKRLQLLRVPQP